MRTRSTFSRVSLSFLLRVVELLAVEADVGGLFDEARGGPRAQGEHLLDHALSHEGVAVLADLGAHEELDDVLEAHLAAVDEVFVLAAAVGAAGDDDLVELDGQPVLAVVERDADFGDAHRRALVAAGEDDVLGLAGAEGAAGVLAEDPAEGVGDVRLAGAVGADDAGDAGAELELRLVGEALEAVDVEPLEVQASSLPRSIVVQCVLRRFLLRHLLAAAFACAERLCCRRSPAR